MEHSRSVSLSFYYYYYSVSFDWVINDVQHPDRSITNNSLQPPPQHDVILVPIYAFTSCQSIYLMAANAEATWIKSL